MQKIDTTEDKILIQHDEVKKQILESLYTEKEHIPISEISKKTGIERRKLFHHVNVPGADAPGASEFEHFPLIS